MRKHLTLCYNHISQYTAIDPAHTTTDVFSKQLLKLLLKQANQMTKMR